MLSRNVIRLIVTVCLLCILTPARSQVSDTVVVNFDFNRSDLKINASAIIDKYLSSIGENYIIETVSLSGYTDKIGSNGYNNRLSFKRVGAVKNYLVGKSVKPEMVISEKGLGKQFPLNDNSTEAFRAMNRRVEIVFSKNLVLKSTQDFSTDAIKTDSLYDTIMDSSTTVGSKIILKNLNFIGGRDIPLSESYPSLNELLRIMKATPKLEIEIQGHVCCIAAGLDNYDRESKAMDLSVRRAKFVYNFLVTNGIDEDRMTYAGFGANQKLYPEEKNAMEQSLNRRVEIKLRKK